MDALGLRRAVIVGHSMGSLVALRFAIDRPDRTAGLVLLGAFPTIKGHPEVQAFWDTALARLTDPVDPALARAFQESTIATPIAPAQLDLFVAESLRVPARVWRETFREFLAVDFSAEISRIAAPALIVAGGRDTFSRRQERDALAAAPAAGDRRRLSRHRARAALGGARPCRRGHRSLPGAGRGRSCRRRCGRAAAASRTSAGSAALDPGAAAEALEPPAQERAEDGHVLRGRRPCSTRRPACVSRATWPDGRARRRGRTARARRWRRSPPTRRGTAPRACDPCGRPARTARSRRRA